MYVLVGVFSVFMLYYAAKVETLRRADPPPKESYYLSRQFQTRDISQLHISFDRV